MGVASEEREQLCALLEEVGPDAPTLCAGWATKDLAAHLVLRERRPDAALGILVGPLAGHTNRVQQRLARQPWTALVRLVRTGPPLWSPFAVPPIGDRVNGLEYFVHHEDVRRAQPDWQPRPADSRLDALLWNVLQRAGGVLYRNSPVGVEVRRPDGAQLSLKRGQRVVRIVGEPAELALHAYGREAVHVEFEGDPADVAAVRDASRGL